MAASALQSILGGFQTAATGVLPPALQDVFAPSAATAAAAAKAPASAAVASIPNTPASGDAPVTTAQKAGAWITTPTGIAVSIGLALVIGYMLLKHK